MGKEYAFDHDNSIILFTDDVVIIKKIRNFACGKF